MTNTIDLSDVFRDPRIAFVHLRRRDTMQIDIQARGFSLTPALRSHAERRLRHAFGSVQAQVGRVTIRLTDDNGPRGGDDKRCLVQASLRGGSPVVVEDIEHDLYVAIDRALDRAGRAAVRRVARRREDRRGEFSAPVAPEAAHAPGRVPAAEARGAA
jgi:putative sigma-54 modulation protein